MVVLEVVAVLGWVLGLLVAAVVVTGVVMSRKPKDEERR